MEGWVKENVHYIMIVVGIASLLGVAVIFAAYIALKRKIQKEKKS